MWQPAMLQLAKDGDHRSSPGCMARPGVLLACSCGMVQQGSICMEIRARFQGLAAPVRTAHDQESSTAPEQESAPARGPGAP